MYATEARGFELHKVRFYTAIAIVVLVLAYVGVLLKSFEDRSGLSRLWLLCVIQMTPLIWGFARKNFNYIAFVCFNHFFTFSIPKYNEFALLSKQGDFFPETVNALEEMTLCTIILIVTYSFARLFFLTRTLTKGEPRRLTLTRLQVYAIGGYLFAATVLIKHIPERIAALNYMMINTLMIVLFTSRTSDNSRLLHFAKLCTGLCTCIWFLQTGSLASVGTLATIVFVMYIVERNYRYLLLLTIATVTISGVQSVKGGYRLMIREDQSIPLAERASYLGKLLFMTYVDHDDPEILETIPELEEFNDDGERRDTVDTLVQGFSRLGDNSLERVLAWTPSRVPFWNGDSYYTLPFMFIPRALWPEKPSREFWNRFGHEFGYLHEDDTETSIAISYLAEAYMNYGYPGLYWCAIFMGFFIALVEWAALKYLRGYYSFSFIIFLIPLINYSIDLGSLLNSLVILSGLLFVLRRWLFRMAAHDIYS